MSNQPNTVARNELSCAKGISAVFLRLVDVPAEREEWRIVSGGKTNSKVEASRQLVKDANTWIS
jgi:hypothetical protein